MVYEVPLSGSHSIHIRPLPIKSTFNFNVTRIDSVAIEIDVIQDFGA